MDGTQCHGTDHKAGNGNKTERSKAGTRALQQGMSFTLE